MAMAAPIRTITAIRMTDPGLLTLSQWLSPAFPVGGFAYSHGLEWAVEAGDVHDAASFRAWIEDVLSHGSGRNDAILLSLAARSAPEDLSRLDALARALAPSAERLMETALQGEAFARTAAAIWPVPPSTCAYPVALGAAVRAMGLDLPAALALFVQGFAGNLTSAAIRLVPLGQTEGHAVLAALAPLCRTLAAEAAEADEDALGGCAFAADIASMRHETQYSRLFRS